MDCDESVMEGRKKQKNKPVDFTRELHTCLIRYYARLNKLDEKWKELSKSAERPLEGLANRTEQFRYVTNKIEGTEDYVNQEVRDRLIFKIFMGLEEEMTILLNILTQFNDANQDLKNYLVNLENARSKVSLEDEDMKELNEGTPWRPALNLLMQWAVEGFQFYHNMYLRINNCMKLVDYKKEETIDNLISSFTEDKRGRRNIDGIFIFTHFLAKETVH
ncbi:hypothetical protein P5V15_010429 [Pogonomyrmex californicus]